MPQLPRAGKRILLRRLLSTDLTAFQDYRHDADVGRYQGWSPQPDHESARFIAAMNAAALLCPGIWLQLGIAAKETNQLIGDIGLCLSADGTSAEIGFTLGAMAQGRGLASEAVRGAVDLLIESTAVERIVAITDSRNLSCIKLLERIGMHRIETREAVFRGQPCIEYAYALRRG